MDAVAVHGFPLDWNHWHINEWPQTRGNDRRDAAHYLHHMGRQLAHPLARQAHHLAEIFPLRIYCVVPV